MKQLVTAVFLAGLLWSAGVLAQTFEANVSEPVTNGDVVRVQDVKAEPGSTVQYVFLIKRNDPSQVNGEYELLATDNLRVSADGTVSGEVTIEGLDVNDREATVWILMSSGQYLTMDADFEVVGDEPERTRGPSAPMAGSFTVQDDNGGLFDVSDVLSAASSSGFTGLSIFAQFFQQRDSGDNTVGTNTAPGSGGLSVSGDGLTGTATRNGDAFDPATVTISYGMFTSDFQQVISGNRLTAAESDPPGIASAVVTSFTNIQITFDEGVSEVGGDAAVMFDFTGADGGGVSASSMAPVGSEPATVWNMTISGLSDRDPDIDIAYDQTNGAVSLQDFAGNEMENTSPAVTAVDGIAPSQPILIAPASNTIISGDVTLTATADAASTDGSMASVRFEGSNDGSNWTQVGQDTDTGDATYSATYTPGTKYSFYRAVAVDDQSDETNSASSANLSDAYRIEITAFDSPVDAGVRSAFTITIQNNYQDAATLAFNSTYTLTSDQGTGTFYNAGSGGSTITTVNIASGNSTANFWYADLNDGSTPTVTVTEAGGNLTDDNDSQQITINSSDADHFRVTTANGESETAGTAFDITVTAYKSDSTVATGYVGTRSLTWTTTATASPDGTTPDVPADGNYTFSNGAVTVSGGGTLYNAGEAPIILASDGSVATTTIRDAGFQVTVSAGAATEIRIKTAAESVDGNYGNNIFGALTVQGPTQADPDVDVDLFAVTYDNYGNLITPAETGLWGRTGGITGDNGAYTLGGLQSSNTYTFTPGTNAGTTYSGTLTFISAGASGGSDATGTITVDDDDGATVTGFGITTDGDDQNFVFASWSGTSSGDDGTSGTPSGYDIRWTEEANGPIDTEVEWDAAQSVPSDGKPAFSNGLWRINMAPTGVEGNKYFAIRTTDDVGNISVLGSGSFTTSSDFSLPVSLNAFEAISGYGEVKLTW